jgi:hypothetical protein
MTMPTLHSIRSRSFAAHRPVVGAARLGLLALVVTVSACDKGAQPAGSSGAGDKGNATVDQAAALKAVDDSVAKLLARVDSSTTSLRQEVMDQERSLELIREGNPSALAKLTTVVDQFVTMKATLKAKDDTIATLRERIRSLVAENKRLRAQIASLTGSVAARDSLLGRSDSVMKVVDARLMETEATRDSIRKALNTRQVLIAERRELERLGIAGKTNRFGLGQTVLKKVDPSLLQTVDMTTTTSFDVPAGASKVQVLTTHGEGSFQVVPNGANSQVRIQNPDAFWAASKVLVIMFTK